MAMNVSLDSNNPDDKCSRYEALSWINETLHTNFTQVEQCRSGTVYIFFFVNLHIANSFKLNLHKCIFLCVCVFFLKVHVFAS